MYERGSSLARWIAAALTYRVGAPARLAGVPPASLADLINNLGAALPAPAAADNM